MRVDGDIDCDATNPAGVTTLTSSRSESATRLQTARADACRSMSFVGRVFAALAGAGLSIGLLAACPGSQNPSDSREASAPYAFARGAGHFVFSDWVGPPLPVWTYAPEDKPLADLPVVVVMHGVKRDGDRYRDEWMQAAREHDLIVLAPTFSDADFPQAAGYNIGNIRDPETGAWTDERLWSFSAIDPLVADAVKRIGGAQTSYVLYGHSAGAQFVHRYLYFKAETRADLFIVANAGWYTMPDFGTPFPYGLAESTLDTAHLDCALQRNVVVLLGSKDIDEADPNLRSTPEAMMQGRHRLARGQSFFRTARDQAAAIGAAFNWRQLNVPGAHHSNTLMSSAAALLVRDHDAIRHDCYREAGSCECAREN